MTLKKGDRVEVQTNDDIPVSWRVANVLFRNGHSYCVVYDYYPDMENEQIVETVPRKLLRPCPPVVQGVNNCIVGDIVEVFCEFTWKVATILSVIKMKGESRSKKSSVRYLVRILGCSEEIIFDESNIRMRQIWHDKKWILVKKHSQVDDDIITDKPYTSNFHQKVNSCVLEINARAKKRPRSDYSNAQDEAAFLRPSRSPKIMTPNEINTGALRQPQNDYSKAREATLMKFDLMHSRSLKMKMAYDSSIIGDNLPTEKLSAVKEDGNKQRLVTTGIPDKVDAVYYPRENMGDKNMCAAFNFISTGRNRMETAKLNSSWESDDACSVGSCSVADWDSNDFFIPSIPYPYRETDTAVCSDMESYCGSFSERKCSSFPLQEKSGSNIHDLQLQAYRKTLEALYASGPLSWEQEALLTNLRLTLHISNDEHLMELKNLISAKTSRATFGGMYHLLPNLKDDVGVLLPFSGIICWTITAVLFQSGHFFTTTWYRYCIFSVFYF